MILLRLCVIMSLVVSTFGYWRESKEKKIIDCCVFTIGADRVLR